MKYVVYVFHLKKKTEKARHKHFENRKRKRTIIKETMILLF